MIGKGNRKRRILGVLVAVTVAFPFANLLHVLYPVTIFSKSAWIIAPVMALGLAYLYLIAANPKKLKQLDLAILFVVLIGVSIFLVREIIYSEGRSPLDHRYIATSLMFIALFGHLRTDDMFIKASAYALFTQGVLVALARSINYYIFPHVMVSTDEGGGGGSNSYINIDGEVTRDLLLGSSFSANLIVCAMLMLFVIKRDVLKKLPFTIFLATQFFMMVSTFNTGSRFPITVAIGLFFFSAYQTRRFGRRKVFRLLFVGCAVLAFAMLVSSEYSMFFERFDQDAGGRYEKLRLVFLLVSASATEFLIGSSSYVAESTSFNGIGLSDNSYGLVAVLFGVPFTAIFWGILIYTMFSIATDKVSMVFLLYILLGFGVTNSILWEPWVFTAFLGFCVASHYGRAKSNGNGENNIRAVALPRVS